MSEAIRELGRRHRTKRQGERERIAALRRREEHLRKRITSKEASGSGDPSYDKQEASALAWILEEREHLGAELAAKDAEIAALKEEIENSTACSLSWQREYEHLCHQMFKRNAEIAALRVEVEQLRSVMSCFPFCPDHRDKVAGLECRECEIAALRTTVLNARRVVRAAIAYRQPGYIADEYANEFQRLYANQYPAVRRALEEGV